MAPEGETSATRHMGEQIPMETSDGGHIQLGPQLNTILEIYTDLESRKQPPSKGVGAPVPPVTSVHPEAPDNLLEALQGPSIFEEHRILMGMVVERVQSIKSGLIEACTSLLIGFEVSDVIV